MCEQRRLRSACAHAQADLSFRFRLTASSESVDCRCEHRSEGVGVQVDPSFCCFETGVRLTFLVARFTLLIIFVTNIVLIHIILLATSEVCKKNYVIQFVLGPLCILAT